MSTLEVNSIDKESGSTLTLGTSGTTVDIPSGATLDVTGATVSGLSAGKVLQVVQGTYATQASTTGTTYVTTNLSASITPSSTSNKVLVTGLVNSVYSTHSGGLAGAYIAIYRGGSAIVAPAAWQYNAGNSIATTMPFNYLDSPSSTSSVTYEIYFKKHTGTTTYVQDSGNPSYITLMEIEA